MLKKYVDKNNPFDNRIDPLNNRQLRSSISVVGYKGMDSSAISRKKSSAESEDSDAEGAVSIADSGAEGDAKLGKRTLIAEKANVNSEGEDHLSKRTKETRSLSQTSTKADTIYPESVVAYPVMEVDTNSS
eukprot:gene1213-1634_t